MPGSFDLDNSRPPLTANALAVAVYKYAPPSSYQLLPNIRCVSVEYKEGPDPPVCRLEYIMDDSLSLNLGWPSNFEDLWPIDAQGPYVVNPDDRLVVAAQNPDGSNLILFDGFAQIPQADVTPQSQRVTFTAVSVAARCFDDIITGRVERDADRPEDGSGLADVETDLPCRFNPANETIGGRGGFLGNSTPNANFTHDSGNVAVKDGKGLGDFPVFIDPLLSEREQVNQEEENPDEGGTDAGTLVAPWYVSDAIKYLLSQPNPGDKLVAWPKFADLDKLLQARYPDGTGPFDPSDPAVPAANIMIRDFDATNKPVLTSIGELMGYAGFVLTWQLAADGDGDPQTSLRIYRRDAGASTAPKLVYLPESDPANRPAVNPATSNVIGLHLARDCNAIANSWVVESAQRQVEVTIHLAPLFAPLAGDETAAGKVPFQRVNLTAAEAYIRRKYRWYGADEAGDGHWVGVDQEASHTPIDLSPAFPDDDDGSKSYVNRYRPGGHTLISRDPQGKPLSATLEIRQNAIGADPFVETDPELGNWYTIPHGWKMLDDRLGIEVTEEDPDMWATGNPKLPKIRGIAWQSTPDGSGCQPFSLRLTTVLEDDLRMTISAPKRIASPTKFTRWRAADARDHFGSATVHPGSVFYGQQPGQNGTDPVVVRDDTEVAETHARQLRSAHEFPPLAGSAVIPFITPYYEVGDRLKVIKGRDVSLATNIGVDQGESPVYPWIVGVSWNFEGDRQTTTLQLSDRRAEAKKL